jgi:hypothetical protein
MTSVEPLFVAPYATFFSPSKNSALFPATLLVVDAPYVFSLRVWRGDVPSLTTSVTVTRRDRSLLKDTAAAPGIVYRSAATRVDVIVAVCSQTDTLPDSSSAQRLLSSSAGLSYRWHQLTGPAVAVTTDAFNKVQLLLPPATLETFATYSFGVTVSSSDATILPATSNITFVVQSAVPVALIAGPQYRTLAYDAALTLDASSSFDVDYAGRGSSQLAFFWTFPTLTAATPVTAACQTQHDAFIFTWVTLDLTSSQLTLPPQSNLLCPHLQYRFTVVVAHANLPPEFANTPTSPLSSQTRRHRLPLQAPLYVHSPLQLRLSTPIASFSTPFRPANGCACKRR